MEEITEEEMEILKEREKRLLKYEIDMVKRFIKIMLDIFIIALSIAFIDHIARFFI